MIARPPTMSTGGMVSASHPMASAAGARILADGGNAIDATLAMAAITWLTLPGQCGLGGDAFAVVREPDGSVWTVSGSGYGPDGGDAGFYRARGYDAIPLDGPLAVSVPGAPAALSAIHRRGASRDLVDLWGPAADAAERGIPCSAKTQRDVAEAIGAIRADEGLSRWLTEDGLVPLVGTITANKELAQSIRELSADPGSFYEGVLAERCVDALTRAGAPFSGDEWAATGAVAIERAIVGDYAGGRIHQTPLPTPGWMVLQQAAMCDGVVGFSPFLSAEAIDRLARSAQRSFADRLMLVGSDDPGVLDEVLEPSRILRHRSELDTGACAVVDLASMRGGDTTSTVAVDDEGRAVSFIHSLAYTFGAKYTVPGTGIVLNNRLGRGAYLIPGHPNEVAPRRKPLHTLNAWVVTDSSGALMHVGNTPGGDGQVQWNMQLLSHLLDHGMNPQEAVSAPRFTVFPGSDADVLGSPAELRLEAGVADPVRSELVARGHRVRLLPEWGEQGSAQIISLGDNGVFYGGSDPRQEGVAIGV